MNSYRLNTPYPAISVKEKNIYYAETLTTVYSGPYSELTAIGTYAYQSIMTEKTDKKLSDIIECIAITEIKHFRILAEIIRMLGGYPKFLSVNKSRGQWWSTQSVLYDVDPEIFLRKNIEEELYGINQYNNIRKKIDDKSINSVIERIILDEEHHIKIFEELLK